MRGAAVVILLLAALWARAFDGETVIDADSVYRCPKVDGPGTLSVTAAPLSNRPRNGESLPKWGVEWKDNAGETYRISISWGNTDYGGFDDSRFMRVSLIKGDSIMESVTVTTGVNMYKGFNRLNVSIGGGNAVEWSVGVETVAASGVFDTASEPDWGSVGVFATGTGLRIVDISFTQSKSPQSVAMTAYTSPESFKLPASAADSPEGLWEYLDRDTDAKWAVPGGLYSLGVTRADEPGQWLVIYLGGAVTNAGEWKPGMVKGVLKSTPFARHYNLEWVDATFDTLDRWSECSATMSDDGSILTFSFPLDHATLRFYRP